MESSIEGCSSKSLIARRPKALSTFHKSIKYFRIQLVEWKDEQKHFKVLPLDNVPQKRSYYCHVVSLSI